MDKTTKLEDKEDIKKIFNKWGTYQSLRKDVAIVQYFMDRIDQKVRQKTVVEHFKYLMTPKTCREHLYRLCKKGILKEDEDFVGTYVFPSRSVLGSNYSLVDDMNKLIQAIVGKDIYDMAISRLKSEYEEKIRNLRKQLDGCYESLHRYQ